MKHFDHRRHHDEDHRGGRGRGHEHGGRGGPGRFFESGDLRHVILHLISDAPRHGYEIIKLIEARMSGSHSPSPGIVYPTLTMLEEMGLAAVKAEGTRKLYTITEEGQRDLAANRAAVDAILQRMQRAGEQAVQDRPPQIMRAMENLKMALRMRSGQWSREQLDAVTDIIDNAARQIERL